MHSAGSSARMYEPTHRCSPSIVRSAALRSHVFSGWNSNSIRVKVRRIRRQVAQACTDSLDRLFHTPNLVERDIVDHHNVSALERWDQTLLYVSQEGLSIHGSFDQHRSHDAGLPQPSDKRHRIPVSHRGIADQALAAWFQPLSRSMLVVTAVSSINTRWAGSRKPCSRIQRRRARATSARLRSSACKLFFDGNAMCGDEAGQRATTSWDSPLVKRRNNLIERKIPSRADECENLPRMLLQGRSASPRAKYSLREASV